MGGTIVRMCFIDISLSILSCRETENSGWTAPSIGSRHTTVGKLLRLIETHLRPISSSSTELERSDYFQAAKAQLGTASIGVIGAITALSVERVETLGRYEHEKVQLLLDQSSRNQPDSEAE